MLSHTLDLSLKMRLRCPCRRGFAGPKFKVPSLPEVFHNGPSELGNLTRFGSFRVRLGEEANAESDFQQLIERS